MADVDKTKIEAYLKRMRKLTKAELLDRLLSQESMMLDVYKNRNDWMTLACGLEALIRDTARHIHQGRRAASNFLEKQRPFRYQPPARKKVDKNRQRQERRNMLDGMDEDFKKAADIEAETPVTAGNVGANSEAASMLTLSGGDPWVAVTKIAAKVVELQKMDERCFRMNSHQHEHPDPFQRTHPFTCGNDSRHRPLIATLTCWKCADCAYTQQYGHPVEEMMGRGPTQVLHQDRPGVQGPAAPAVGDVGQV